MPLPAIERYEFGPYRIDTGERLLHRGDELISLPPKVAGTLLVLVRSAGRMVDKADLMKAVWPDTFVEEGPSPGTSPCSGKHLGIWEMRPYTSRRFPSGATGL